MKFGNLVSVPSARACGTPGRGLRRRSDARLTGRRPRRQRRVHPAGTRDRRTADRWSVGRTELGAALRRRAQAAGAGRHGRAADHAVRPGRRRYARQSVDLGPASTHSTNFAYNVGAGPTWRSGPGRPAADGEGLHREVRCAGGDGARCRHQDDAQLRGERGAAAGTCSWRGETTDSSACAKRRSALAESATSSGVAEQSSAGWDAGSSSEDPHRRRQIEAARPGAARSSSRSRPRPPGSAAAGGYGRRR